MAGGGGGRDREVGTQKKVAMGETDESNEILYLAMITIEVENLSRW